MWYRYIFLILLLFFLSQICIARGKLLLVGGGSENYNAWSDIPYSWAVDQSNNKKVAIVSYNPGSDPDWLPDYFKTLGAVEAKNFIIDSRSEAGDPTKVAGTSAGAAVMSQMMITGDEKKHPDYQSTFSSLEFENIIIADGLGLLDHDIIIDQHFVERSRYNRLLTAIIEFPEKTGIGISESTAILVQGDTAEVVGKAQVIKFSNPQGNQKINNGLLGAENLNLSVYLPGDKFKLK